MALMNNQYDTSPVSIWNTWPTSRIIALMVLLMGGDMVLQLIIYSLGGGLFIPVLLGTVGGVLLPLYFVVRTANLTGLDDFSLKRQAPIVLLASALMAIAALAPTSMMAQLSLSLHPPDPEWAAFMAENMPKGPLGIALAFLTVVVAAPLAEELIFRGLLHRLSSRLWGPWAATAISSLIFGIVHGEPWYLFGLIGVGIVLAVVYEATGSVLACWVTHMVHNAISLAMMVWADQPTSETMPLTMNDWLIAGGSLIALVLLSVLMLQARRRGEASKNPDQS